MSAADEARALLAEIAAAERAEDALDRGATDEAWRAGRTRTKAAHHAAEANAERLLAALCAEVDALRAALAAKDGAP